MQPSHENNKTAKVFKYSIINVLDFYSAMYENDILREFDFMPEVNVLAPSLEHYNLINLIKGNK